MTCQEVVQSLSDYIDGTLAAQVRASVEEHIAVCHDCHVVLDSTQCTILLYRAARTTALSGEQRQQLLGKLEAACRDCGRSDDPPGR
jgi:anti-sigma factor RsiW